MNLTSEGYKVIMSESEFDLTVIHADEVTAVEVTFWGKETYRTTGAAKRHPDDADDAALGEKLAVSRALKKLSDELAKDARKAVARADDKRRKAAAEDAKAAVEAKAAALAAEYATLYFDPAVNNPYNYGYQPSWGYGPVRGY